MPISQLVNSSQVSSSDPALSPDSILIKWRPVTSAGIGSWENHATVSGGRLLSWLVSLLTEDVMGFVVEGSFVCLVLHHSFPSPHNLLVLPLSCPLSCDQILTLLEAISSTSLNSSLSPVLVLVSRSPSLSTRPSRLGPSESIFLGSLTSASTSSTQDW
jgi:hypothetical protein